MNSEISSQLPSKVPPKWLLVIFASVAFVGFVDATYLTALHFLGEVPPCSIIEGCEQVTTSKYATIGSVPIALLGAVYYLLIFFMTIISLDSGRFRHLVGAIALTWAGLAVSLFLFYLQIFVIRALCLYCIFSALTTGILFMLGFILLYYKKGRFF